MENSQKVNRREILNKAKEESELSDLKQHADKMIRGFENFNNFSSNRAVWELVQNACDLSTECDVVLDYSHGFSFTHNGKPFTTKSLISLIKQVSGKYGEGSDIPEVGKYGTGFLTTHTFGRKFKIDSILEAEDNFFEIKEFLIDRTPKEWKELSQEIKRQKDNVYTLIEEGATLDNPEIKTTFTYIPETKQEEIYIADSSRDLKDYIPIVLTLNDRLKKVTVIMNNAETSYEQIEKTKVENDADIELYKTLISINGAEKKIYSIIDSDDHIEVILPIDENLNLFLFSERIARLFLYFPLIGSENFGFNFIVNCKKFLPTEPRDNIYLQSNKDQVKDQEEENRRVIEKTTNLIFTFLKSSILDVSNRHFYAQINFKRNTDNDFLNEYFDSLQKSWMEECNTLPFVETNDGNRAISEVYFFKEELLESKEHFDDIYYLVELFYPIPSKENVHIWTDFAVQWASEDTQFIGHQELVEKISEKQLSDFNQESLISYYELLLKERKNYFSDYALLPNLDGDFHCSSQLRKPQDLNETLIQIGKSLIPNSMEKLIHKDFQFNFKLELFNRRDFSNSIKTTLDDKFSHFIYLSDTFDEDDYNISSYDDIEKVETDFFESLLKYCKLKNDINSQSKPSLLMKIISKYYSIDESLVSLSKLENQGEDLDIRYPRKVLVQIFFNLLKFHNERWVEQNIELLSEIAKCNEDSLNEVYSSSNIYPNQVFQLKTIDELKRDIEIIPEIKDLYNKVTTDEVRKSLIYEGFNEFVTDDRFIDNKYLTNQIEEAFFEIDINNINEHPFKEEILHIISSLKDEQYRSLFPRLNEKKANLMLEVVTNENTKDEIFSIVTLEESELKKLGQLVKEDNFSTILDKASDSVQQQLETEADFRHKHEIGTYIEKLIREKLTDELKNSVTVVSETETRDKQGGQDIVISLNQNPVYFIEVKSRWNSQNSVSMSKLQLQRSVEENERYALCAVDITRYTGKNDKYSLPIDEVLPITNFVTQIGTTIKPLIEDNLEAEKQQDKTIHLIDYRGVIPQDIIQSGKDFNNFIKLITDEILKEAHLKNITDSSC